MEREAVMRTPIAQLCLPSVRVELRLARRGERNDTRNIIKVVSSNELSLDETFLDVANSDNGERLTEDSSKNSLKKKA